MSYQSEPIYKAIMGGEILGLQQAIAGIVRALEGVNKGTLDGADLDEAIYAAADLIPPEMLDEEAVPRKQTKKPAPPASYEDLL